jgi:hypothetical protein
MVYDLKLSSRVTDFRHICTLGPDQTLKFKAPALPFWQIKSRIIINSRFADFINACIALRELPYASHAQFCALSFNVALPITPPFSAVQT